MARRRSAAIATIYKPAQNVPRPLVQRLASSALAPLRGSRILFPRRLAAALRNAPAGPPIGNAEARWFFGNLTFWIDPAVLTSRLHDQVDDGAEKFWLSDRFLDAGDWSALIGSETVLPEHQEMRELVRYRSSFRDAPTYRMLANRAASGQPARRLIMTLDSTEAVDRYFRHYLELIERIEVEGYRDRYELGVYQPPGGGGRRARLKGQHKRNIGVAIGAKGELLRFLGGRHRTAIAQGLGLPSVPVEARLVHADWLREECRRTGRDPIASLRAFVATRGKLPEPNRSWSG